MIKKIVCGDITAPTSEPHDIIIGMNTELGELSALGREILQSNLPPPNLIDLGTVLSFQYDISRMLHMIICHHLGNGGWRNADQYVRVALDRLWIDGSLGPRKFGIVQIGRGEVGKKYGADPGKILTAIADSYLPMELFVRNEADEAVIHSPSGPGLRFVQGWSQKSGVLAPR